MENKTDLSIAYAEVYEILSFMEQKYVNMIPLKLFNLFKEERDKEYKPNINNTIPLNEQNLQKKTLSILAMLNLNYWCTDEKEKQELMKLYAENDKKREEKLREKYNPDNLFKNKEPKEQIYSNNTDLVEYHEENFLKKIIRKIMNLFKRK